MKQTDFILKGQERGYSKEEIADARDKFYAQGNSFDDDPKPQFTPNATLNNSLSESLDDEQNSLFDEHEKAKTTLHAFEGSKIGDTQQQIESGVKSNTYDDMIRKERGLSEDESIDYPTVLNEKKHSIQKKMTNILLVMKIDILTLILKLHKKYLKWQTKG